MPKYVVALLNGQAWETELDETTVIDMFVRKPPLQFEGKPADAPEATLRKVVVRTEHISSIEAV